MQLSLLIICKRRFMDWLLLFGSDRFIVPMDDLLVTLDDLLLTLNCRRLALYQKSDATQGSKHLGPVVQSIVSLTSSLRDQLDFITKHTDIFVEKFHFFNKNIGIFEILTFEILTKR